jgi:dihydrofolate reductase
VCVLTRKPALDLYTDAIALALADIRAIPSIARQGERIWICGGGDVFKLALQSGIVDVIDLTIVPEVDPLPLVGSESVRLSYFPANLLEGHRSVKETPNEEDRRLIHRRYERLTQP